MNKRPNFIFILADDLGYADLGCYGGRVPVSPNLDKLASQGMLFTQGYANSSVCSPTRFALITGRYQYRLRGGAEEPLAGSLIGTERIGLPPEHPTLPSVLRDAGYNTALIGKWHLGYPPHFGPEKSGYQEHFGSYSGAVDYFSHKTYRGGHDLWHNGVETDVDGYLTDVLSERACEFVRGSASKAKPFLLSLHYTAPHWPWESRDDRATSDAIGNQINHATGGSIHTYRRMIQHMDEGIGRLMAELDAQGIADDTVVVFTSDNGGERFSDNWPLIGGKMDLTDGGIRVPYIVRWPGHVPAGARSSQPVITMDWVATFFDVAGASASADYPLDGVSLVPLITAPADAPMSLDRPLFWRMNHRHQGAMRLGDWKFLRIEDNEYLFNLAADERERANQATVQPDRLAAMRKQYDEWLATMPPIPEDARVSLVITEKDMPAAHLR